MLILAETLCYANLGDKSEAMTLNFYDLSLFPEKVIFAFFELFNL